MFKKLSLYFLLTGFILITCLVSMANEPVLTENSVTEEVSMDNADWTPEWAKKVVWYQIFPERFYNGDPCNDPEVKNIEGSWPHDHTSPWEVHPWTSDWYELQPYEQENGKDIWFNIQRRRYGGDIQGIIDRLDYLQDLGVTAIYLNPVFESPSLHKYDGIMYHHIDANFGPDPEGDRALIATEVPDDPGTWVWTEADKLFLRLVEEVHKRDMKIIIDGVFNHIGLKNPFFQDVLKNQENSRYKDWFIIKSWDNPETGETFDYEGWFGVRELPEWREDENGIVEGPKKYIFDITRRWMDPDEDGNPSDGIDGWRLDVAFCVGHPFWKDWSAHVKSINPEAYMTAEIIDTVETNKAYLEGDEFTAVMNYNFAFTSSEYFVDKKNRISTSDFDRKLRELREAYDPSVAYVMQNLFDSHDTARLGSHIVNRDRFSYRDWQDYCEKARPEKNPDFDTRKPAEEELKVHKLFVIFQMTYPGSPMVYYGDEAGMWGATDPCCRKPMVWEDITYSDEVYLPDGSKREVPDKVEFNRDLYEHYKKLIKIRNNNESLQLGDYETLFIDDENEIYGFSRNYKDEHIIVLINNSNKKWEGKIEAGISGSFTDLLNGDALYDTGDRGDLEVDIEPLWGRILRFKTEE